MKQPCRTLAVLSFAITGCVSAATSEDMANYQEARRQVASYLALTISVPREQLRDNKDERNRVRVFLSEKDGKPTIAHVQNSESPQRMEPDWKCVDFSYLYPHGWKGDFGETLFECRSKELRPQTWPTTSFADVDRYRLALLEDLFKKYREDVDTVRSLLGQNDSIDQAIGIVKLYRGHDFTPQLKEAFQAAVVNRQDRAALRLLDIVKRYPGSDVTAQLKDALKTAIATGQEPIATPIHDELMSRRAFSDAEQFAWQLDPALIGREFDEVSRVVDSGDANAIKLAYDAAKSPPARRLIEGLLVQKNAARLLSITYTAKGLGDARAYGGTGTGGFAQVMTAAFGYKVGTEATTKIDYQLRLDEKVFKVSNDYRFEADVVLTARGDGAYETHCAWPLPTVCKNGLTSETYAAKIDGVLKRNAPFSGETTITWKPKYESRGMSGLTRYFVTSSVEVKIVNIKIKPMGGS